MRIFIIDELVFVNKEGKLITMQHGKIYKVPNEWGREISKEGSGAEYNKIDEDSQK